jgi:CBS domain containing-hemolysin-like protein
MSILWLVAAVALLVLLNGFCVAAEFSLAGVRRSKLESLAGTGRRGARRVLAMTGDFRTLDHSFATAQAGITLASLGLGMYAEESLANVLHPILGNLGSHGVASVVALALLTYVHVVAGEVVPKTIALQHPEETALRVQVLLRVLRVALAPFVFLLDRASTGVLKLLRIQAPTKAARAHTLEEIQTLAEEGGQDGALARKQIWLLRNLLEFEDLPVRKVMVPRNRVVGLPVGSGAGEVLSFLRATSHTRYPVFEGNLDRILGFVHTKELLGALDEGEAFDLRELARPVPMVPETAKARKLLRLFRDEQVHMAVVLDEHGGTAGVATLQDLLEEIFGEVQDEFDREEPPIRPIAEGAAMLRGSVRLDEIRDAFGLELRGRFVDTVAGLILQRLGRTARQGDTVQVEGAKLTVTAVKGLAISRVRLDLEPPATEEE